jgi:hypothetical protein
MNIEDIKNTIINSKIMEYSEFYKKVKQIKEDVDFFDMYVRRNKTCDRPFTILPCSASDKAFIDIYNAFGFYSEYIEDVYSIYVLMKAIIEDIYDQTMKFNSGQIREFAEYIESDFNLNLKNYVTCFIGCSHGCSATMNDLCDILGDE